MTAAAAACAAAVLAGVVALLVREALPVLRAVGPLRLLTDAAWTPTEGGFGIAPMLAGTALATLGAVLLATPLAVGSAIFQRFYAPRRLGAAFQRLVETLAGVPSVVVGLWGLVVLVPMIARQRPPGASLLAAIIVLALMILPTIAMVTQASLHGVPGDQLRSAAALGLSRWAVVRRVALPAARPGIVAGVTLGAGRALGETMAVLMVAGNVVQLPHGLLAPMRTLTANVALEMPYAQGLHRSALFASGLALGFGVLVFIVAAELARGAGARARG